MRKTFSKVLALSLSSLILLSNLFVLTANALNLAHDNVSSSEESTVEQQPEAQISKVAPKTTVSKVVASETEATEVEPKVETIEPKVEPEVEVAEETPVEEEPETVLPENEEVVEPEIKVDGSKLEETTPKVEVSVPEIKVDSSKLEETTPKVGVSVPEIKVDDSKLEETTPKVKVTLPKIRVDNSKLEETTPKAKVTLPKVRVDVFKLEETTPKVEVSLPEIKVEGSRLGEITPKVEVTLPEIKVDVSKLEETTPEVEVSLPEIKVDSSKLEGTMPKVEVTLPEIKVDGSILTMPKVEVSLPEIRVDSSKLEETTPEVEASLPEIKVDNSKLEETTPKVKTPELSELKFEELLVSGTGNISRGELYTGQKANDYKDKITTMLSDESDQKLRLHSVGNPNIVNFAVFTCDTTMCVGFENGVAEFYEGRRGESDMEVTAPNAKDGYVFVCWEKLGTAPVTVDGTEFPVDVYKAVYAEVKNKFSTMLLEKQVTNILADEEDHKHYSPANGEWTKAENLNEKTITITFGGCYHYISFAEIKYELGEGNVVNVETLARRGEWSETVTAPEKDGYVFKEWKLEHTDKEYIDKYTAVYEKVADEIATENEGSPSSYGVLPNPDMEQLGPSVDDEHTHFKPKDGKDWTSSSELVKGDERSLTVTFRGCYGYVSTARFVCDLSKCEGFDGVGTLELSRRGGWKETIATPKAKDGFKFDHWDKSTVTVENVTVDVYTAVYVDA